MIGGGGGVLLPVGLAGGALGVVGATVAGVSVQVHPDVMARATTTSLYTGLAVLVVTLTPCQAAHGSAL
jgi:hypothetical protein